MLRSARRALTTGAVTVGILCASAAPAMAHGAQARPELPVPLSVFMVGAATLIVVVFISLTGRWPHPRFQDPKPSRALRASWLPRLLRPMCVLALAGLLVVIVDGFAARNVTTRHIGPLLVWVVFWHTLAYVGAAAGDVWRWISPWRCLSAWVNGNRVERRDLADRIGVWPAAVVFIGIVWLELVSPSSMDPTTVAIAAVGYTLYVVAATRWLGVNTGLTAADAFEGYYSAIAAMSPFDVRGPVDIPNGDTPEQPTVMWRGWLRGLPAIPVRSGTTWFIAALIGSVAYDGVTTAPWWSERFAESAGEVWFETIALIGMIGTIGLGYQLAAAAAARLAAGSGATRSAIAASFIHTLHPIAISYLVAHYFTLILFTGQQLLHTASDPFGMGWNLLGTADWRIVTFLSPNVVWWIQLGIIVAGHMAATVLVHDRAVHLFGHEVAVRTQYAMLVLMVAFSSLGLFMLAG